MFSLVEILACVFLYGHSLRIKILLKDSKLQRQWRFLHRDVFIAC